ncbi:TPA: hypothetical protein HA351_09125 [Methanosarcinaceae archaeon]|nr:hypothetical protein [Methanosarcinaceae archaeon]
MSERSERKGPRTAEPQLGWDRLLADYNILKGRVWILVLLTTFLAPWLVGTYLRK